MSIKQKLLAARASRQAASSAQKEQAQVKSESATKARSKAAREAEERNNILQRQIAELQAKQNDLVARQEQARRDALSEERLAYVKRLGPRVDADVLKRILPDVDPRTTEGLQALELFRQQNAGLFGPARPRAGDVTQGAAEKVAAASKTKGRQPVEERKIFGVDLVKSVIAKNLGGGDV
jgi:hypothetical protein